MGVTIGSNIMSLRAQRQLGQTSDRLSSTFERLSSGQRINRASDDAAGLAIASSLDSDRRVFNQGIRNLNDGISALTIAEGALDSLSSIVIRLQELARIIHQREIHSRIEPFTHKFGVDLFARA